MPTSLILEAGPPQDDGAFDTGSVPQNRDLPGHPSAWVQGFWGAIHALSPLSPSLSLSPTGVDVSAQTNLLKGVVERMFFFCIYYLGLYSQDSWTGTSVVESASLLAPSRTLLKSSALSHLFFPQSQSDTS